MFLFGKKKGNMEGGGAIGGLTIIFAIITLYFLWPNLKANFNIPDPNVDQKVESAQNTADKMTNKIDGAISSFTDQIEKEQDGYSYDSNKAREMLSNIKIEEADWDVDDDGEGDYNRDSWEKPVKRFTSKYSGKKIGIKNYVLENTVKMAYDDEKFSFTCPYTGEVLDSARKIDYDHIVPLAYVDGHGGNKWPDSKKNEFAFNTKVGVCSSASSNRAKGAKGPSEWMPSVNQKWYCYKWLEICTEYNISISQADYNVIQGYFSKE